MTKITALIRTHEGRETLTARAIQSCIENGVEYIVKHCKTYPNGDYGYNLDCNEMKEQVEDGWFFFLDSDDYIIDGSIDRIKKHLREDKGLIVQMLRNNNRKKPISKANIKSGGIGLPCLILHSKHKNVANLTAKSNGDWEWIDGVINNIPFMFVPVATVNVGQRNRGK